MAFRSRNPKFNGLIWGYHWLQVGVYEPLLARGVVLRDNPTNNGDTRLVAFDDTVGSRTQIALILGPAARCRFFTQG